MSGKLYRIIENNEKMARRKGHFQRAPTETNSELPSTINTTVESFNAFGINDSVQLNSSEDDMPLRSPFVKNTLPADILARQLAQVVEHQPQLSSEEKVYIWRWEAVVSPVEDMLNFQELFEQREALVANRNKKKNSRSKIKKGNSKIANDILVEDQYSFKEFMKRLEKDLHDSVKLRNILQYNRLKAAVQNIATNIVPKTTQTTRKRAMKAQLNECEEPNNKISKKSTKVEIETNKQLNKITPNRKKRQEQQQNIIKLKQIVEPKKEVVNKPENSLIVFREDFTYKSLHLDKKRAQIFKNIENTSNTQSDCKQITTTTTITTNHDLTTQNDNSGVFHQQHVFCNYLGLTGMSTATALATAAAELSNCATRRFSLRVRQNQQKEKQEQQKKAEKAKEAPKKTTRVSICMEPAVKPQPPKIVSLNIKKAKDQASQKLMDLNILRSKFSISERREAAPVRIVHRFSSISEERPKPKESNIFILPKLKPLNSTAPRKPIFSEEFVKSFQPNRGQIQVMENKKLNIPTKFLRPQTHTSNSLIAQHRNKININNQIKPTTTDLKAMKCETTNSSANIKQEKKIEITSIEVMTPKEASPADNKIQREECKKEEIKLNNEGTNITEVNKEEKSAEMVIVEESPIIESPTNLILNEKFENVHNTQITAEAIQALTENDIIFADDFIISVENANGSEKIIANNINDLIEEVDETDINEQFVRTINNLTNNQKTALESNIDNTHSIDQLNNEIDTDHLNELPLILCNENNTNSFEHEYALKNDIITNNNVASQPVTANGNNAADQQMFLQQGSIVSILPNEPNQSNLVNRIELFPQENLSNNVAVLVESNKVASEKQNNDKNVADIQNMYKNVQYFHNISTKQTQNPLIYKYGKVLYMYYELDILLVVQELMISFWKCSKLLNALKIAKLEELECNKNEWLLLDVCPRSLKDIEIPAPYSSRICIYNGLTHYCELRGYHVPSEEHFFSLYVNVYYYHEEELQGKKRKIDLDSVRSIPQEITYITLFESHYIVFCWSQIVQEKRQKTGMCKYSLAPHFERIACIRDFKELNQHIKHLECINDKLYGYGETTLTVWDHRSGDVFMNFDFQIAVGRNVGSIYYQSPDIVEQNNMMLLFQHVLTLNGEHELLLIMCSLSHITPSYRILKRLALPMPAFHAGVLSAENNGEHIMIRAKKTHVELWISCGDPNTMLLMPPQQQSQCFYVRGRPQVINVTENSVTVDTIINHLLKLQAVDNSLNGHNLST